MFFGRDISFRKRTPNTNCTKRQINSHPTLFIHQCTPWFCWVLNFLIGFSERCFNSCCPLQLLRSRLNLFLRTKFVGSNMGNSWNSHIYLGELQWAKRNFKEIFPTNTILPTFCFTFTALVPALGFSGPERWMMHGESYTLLGINCHINSVKTTCWFHGIFHMEKN